VDPRLTAEPTHPRPGRPALPGEGETRGGFGGRARLTTARDVVDSGCSLGAQLVRRGVPGHDRRVGADVRGREVSTAAPRVLVEEVVDILVESQHGHRGVEAFRDGDESCARLRSDVRGLGHCAVSGGEPGHDPAVTLLEDPSVERVGTCLGGRASGWATHLELVDDPAEVVRYCQARDAAWHFAIRYEELKAQVTSVT
jgi:hypothetical protein